MVDGHVATFLLGVHANRMHAQNLCSLCPARFARSSLRRRHSPRGGAVHTLLSAHALTAAAQLLKSQHVRYLAHVAGPSDMPPEILFAPTQARWLAVKLLLAFMGATMGWAFSYQVFVDTALLAYLSGASVSEISSCLKQHEFSQAGALLQAASDETARSEAVNADAYCRCVCPPKTLAL